VVEVEIRELRRDEVPFAAGVLARGMRDNPGAVAVYGDDPLRRVHDLEAQFRTFLPASRHPPLVACRTGVIVGLLGMAPPGACQASLARRLRVASPLLLRTHLLLRGPDAWLRILSWANAWSARDPKERHWHLGPVAVEAGLQGMGIGSQMMNVFCHRIDAAGDMAFLETDKLENVTFYRKFGFQTIDEIAVLGLRTWFMRRAPGPATSL
jgi:ribosomal protein S18 acetylase RimI-like enzyme